MADADADFGARVSDNIPGQREAVRCDSGRHWRRELVNAARTGTGTGNPTAKFREYTAGLRIARGAEIMLLT